MTQIMIRMGIKTMKEIMNKITLKIMTKIFGLSPVFNKDVKSSEQKEQVVGHHGQNDHSCASQRPGA